MVSQSMASSIGKVSAFTVDHLVYSQNPPVIFAVVDFDGVLVIIACGFSGDDIYWYVNDGSGSYTDRAFDLIVNGPQGLEVNDIDGDGDLDIFATSRLDNQVLLYTNNGSQSFTKTIVDTDIENPHHVKCADLNDDKYMDIIATSRTNDKII